MIPVKDIVFEDNDILISNGDFKIKESDAYHIEDIFQASKGMYYNDPLMGININKYMKSTINPQDLKRLIKIQLENDKFKVNRIEVKINNNILDISTDTERMK